MVLALATAHLAAALWVISVERRAAMGTFDTVVGRARGGVKLISLMTGAASLLLLSCSLPLETAIPLWCVVIMLSALVIAITVSLWPGSRAAGLIIAGPLVAGGALWGLV